MGEAASANQPNGSASVIFTKPAGLKHGTIGSLGLSGGMEQLKNTFAEDQLYVSQAYFYLDDVGGSFRQILHRELTQKNAPSRTKFSKERRILLSEVRRNPASLTRQDGSFDDRMTDFFDDKLIKDTWDNVVLIELGFGNYGCDST
ncbi:hypothetical protein ACVK01_003723 [Paenibacillus sp. PvR148]